MNYLLEQLTAAANKNEYSGFSLELLAEDVEEVLRLGLDADENIERLHFWCMFSCVFGDTAEFDKVFEIADLYRMHLKKSESIAKYEYSIMHLYMRLGFAPKVVDHALNVLDIDNVDAKLAAAVYSNLAVCAKEYGQYDRALEYSLKVKEYLSKGEVIDECTQCITNEDNICNILAVSGKTDELGEHISLLEKCLVENSSNPIVIEYKNAVKTDIMYFHAIKEGYTDELFRNYIESVSEYLNSDRTSFLLSQTIDSHIEILKNMTHEPYIDDCIDICVRILNSDRFNGMGNDEIFRILFKALENKPDAMDSKTVAEYSKRYIKSLETAADKVHDLFSHLMNEEYRIREVNSRYDRLKVKYETDLLTVCYNRPSFELNAAGFIRDNRSGSLSFIDIDNLKTTNDSFGHAAGDLLLKSFVSIAATVFDKKCDLLYRFAGDEFILLSTRTPEETEALMQRLMSAYADTPVFYKDNDISIKFSYGIVGFGEVAELGDDSSIEEGIKLAIQIADKRMYNCKEEHHKLAGKRN